MAKRNTWEDHYTRRARSEKWLARSIYKLEEIDKKHKLIRQGHRVLDLGCSPGSWSQYCLKKVGPKGHVVGVDLEGPAPFSVPHFRFIEGDILELDPKWLAKEIGPMDLVISDMAPKTTGIKVTDASRSLELGNRALTIALIVLKKEGHLLCKVFQGEDQKTLQKKFGDCFTQMRLIRPSAVRKQSKEVYLLGSGFSRRRHGYGGQEGLGGESL
jgi:23S rRNA (uridine2552-2'-O)-methyltransferase